MAALVRDDFTGSGNLAGRTPDGVNSGAWQDDNWWYGGSAGSDAVISGGRVNTTSASWGAKVPLAGNPSAAYVEVQTLIPTNSDWAGFALNRPTGAVNGVGVCCEVQRVNSTQVYVNLATLGTPSHTGTDNDTFTVASAANFVFRMEMNSTAVTVKLDGVQVLAITLNSAPAGGGAWFGVTSSSTDFEYFEAGDLVVPTFWTNFVGTREGL